MEAELSLEQKAKFKERVIKYQSDPSLFCKEILGSDSHWEKQVEIMESVAKNKYTTVPSGHGIGKSFVAADICLWFLYTHLPSIVITTAPTFRQVERVLWG